MNDRAEAVPALLHEIVRHARTGDCGSASSLLNRSVSLMQTALTTGNVQTPVVTRAAELLTDLFNAQKRGDWIGFADIIEFTFIDFWNDNFVAPY
jgi:hypothetical protein